VDFVLKWLQWLEETRGFVPFDTWRSSLRHRLIDIEPHQVMS
jgi:hypothetical protein